MAVTTQGAALTEAHQRAQAARAAVTAALVLRAWRALVDPGNPAQSAVRWIDLVLPQILLRAGGSAALARTYITAFRTVELGGLQPYTPGDPVLPNAEQVRNSLWVTGPKAFLDKVDAIEKRDLDPTLERSMLDQAFEEAGEQAAGATLRHVTEGGRAQVKADVENDRVALGWLRVPRANCCYFCAMLASRGPVYQDDSFEDSNEFFTGEGVAKAHDNCVCGLQPVYSRSDPGLKRAEAWSTLWKDSTGGKSGPAAVKAFRQAYEGRSVA